MLVAYTYRADDAAQEAEIGSSKTSPKTGEMKTFSFYTVLDLGPIIPREVTRTIDSEG